MGDGYQVDPAIGPDGFRRDGLVDDTDEIDGPVIFGGPAGALLEQIRVKFFDDDSCHAGLKGEPRTQVVYERIAEFLADQAEEGLRSDEQQDCTSCSGISAAAERCWGEYVRQTQVSVERRSQLLDEHGSARVTRKHSAGLVSHVDLSDWKGRHRVRLLYDAASQEPKEVRLVSSSGVEVRYTVESFEAPEQEGGIGKALKMRLEAARHSCAQLAHDASPKREQLAQESVVAFCELALPQLEKLLQRELREGRQFVPTSEELLEMDMEEIVALLEGG